MPTFSFVLWREGIVIDDLNSFRGTSECGLLSGAWSISGISRGVVDVALAEPTSWAFSDDGENVFGPGALVVESNGVAWDDL